MRKEHFNVNMDVFLVRQEYFSIISTGHRGSRLEIRFFRRNMWEFLCHQHDSMLFRKWRPFLFSRCLLLTSIIIHNQLFSVMNSSFLRFICLNRWIITSSESFHLFIMSRQPLKIFFGVFLQYLRTLWIIYSCRPSMKISFSLAFSYAFLHISALLHYLEHSPAEKFDLFI